MTPDEIYNWLRRPKDREIPLELAQAMKDVPYPKTDDEEYDAFLLLFATLDRIQGKRPEA